MSEKESGNVPIPEPLLQLHERREPTGRAFLQKLLRGLYLHGSPLERRAFHEAMPLLRRLRGGIYPPHDRLAKQRGIGRNRRYKRHAERIVVVSD